MRKSRFFMLLLAGALAMGIAGGAIIATTTASAQENSDSDSNGQSSGDSSGQSFAARVAAKLNAALGLEEDITEAQVQAAFNGAATDQQEEKLQARLDELEVEEATVTAIMDWFKAYPYTDLVKLRHIGFARSEKVAGVLERLVEKERITQAQSDGVQSWYDDRPELPEGLERSGRHDRDGRRGHHGGRHQDNDGSENDDNGDGDGDGGAGARFNGRRFFRGGGPGRGNSM